MITQNMKPALLDALAASAGAVFGFLFGAVDGLFYALVAFVVLDYITGVVVAIKDKTLSSETGFHGICKKAMIFIVVAVGNIIDVQVIGIEGTLRTAVIFVFIANEGISLLENAGGMGVPIPQKLMLVLRQLREKEDKAE